MSEHQAKNSPPHHPSLHLPFLSAISLDSPPPKSSSSPLPEKLASSTYHGKHQLALRRQHALTNVYSMRVAAALQSNHHQQWSSNTCNSGRLSGAQEPVNHWCIHTNSPMKGGHDCSQLTHFSRKKKKASLMISGSLCFPSSKHGISGENNRMLCELSSL